MIIQVNNFMRLDSTTGAPKIFLWVLSRGKRRLHNQGFMAGFMAWKPFSVAMSPLTVPRVGTSKLGLAAGPPGILAGIASIALVPLYQCNGIWYLGIKSKRHLTSYSWHISGHITICTQIIIYNYIIIHIYIQLACTTSLLVISPCITGPSLLSPRWSPHWVLPPATTGRQTGRTQCPCHRRRWIDGCGRPPRRSFQWHSWAKKTALRWDSLNGWR